MRQNILTILIYSVLFVVELSTPYTLRANDTTSEKLSSRHVLDNYILAALTESAELKSAFADYQAALQRNPQVSALPDPMLSYGYFIKEVQTRVGPQQQRVGLSQPIPWFGKLSLKGEIADLEAQAMYYRFLSIKNRLVHSVVSSYLELAYLKRATQITDANLELLKRWEQVAAQRYRSQTGTQADLIKVQVELGKLEDKLRGLNDLRLPLLAKFNGILNRTTSEEVVLPSDLLSQLASITTSSLDLDNQNELENFIKRANPELLAIQSFIKAKEQGIKLANKSFYPDFSLGADYIAVGSREQASSESGDDALVAMLSVTLPLNRDKYRAEVSEAESKKLATKQMLRSKEFALRSELAQTIFNIKDSERRVKLYRDTLVPKADQSLESSYTAFEAGKSSFLDLLDAERVSLDFQLSLARALADSVISKTALSSLLGEYSEAEQQTIKGTR
jgi:outer membrane protein TolC